MAQSEPSFYSPLFLQTSAYLPLPTRSVNVDAVNMMQLKFHLGQILPSKRFRIVGAAALLITIASIYFHEPATRFISDYSHAPGPPNSVPPAECAEKHVDWSRFAYTQYVTNTEYLCNSVMLFEILHRLGSRADRLMMYPASMHPDTTSSSKESELLLKAQNDYGVKLMPIEVQHRPSGDPTWADSYTKLLAFNQTQYDRVLSLDSDSTVLQHMDELFLLPPAPVAMPRAYWLDKPYLSSQLVLIQPSVEEFKRVKNAIDVAADGNFDMEIVNNLYGKDCMIIPHRRYDLLTGEFRSTGQHQTYLGNEYEHWDPEKVLGEAKFLHFSDWPMPKPWLTAPAATTSKTQPNCDTSILGHKDCRARDIWLGFYHDFKTRRENICGMSPQKIKARSIDAREREPWEFTPTLASDLQKKEAGKFILGRRCSNDD